MATAALELAKETLDEYGCTLVVVKCDKVKVCHNRGVIDLVEMLDSDAQMLLGSSVADKIIGKGAAALMIEGGVREVFSRVITEAAIEMFQRAEILVEYNEVVPLVQNRDKSGRCPIDTICADLKDNREMVAAIYAFLRDKRQN